MNKHQQHEFGGQWTDEKLLRVQKYLTAYAIILKKQNFKFAYIDAFAGAGYRERNAKNGNNDQLSLFNQTEIKEIESYSEGSARIALQTEPSFDKYIFIEKSRKHFSELQKLKDDFHKKQSRSNLLMLMPMNISLIGAITTNGKIIVLFYFLILTECRWDGKLSKQLQIQKLLIFGIYSHLVLD